MTQPPAEPRTTPAASSSPSSPPTPDPPRGIRAPALGVAFRQPPTQQPTPPPTLSTSTASAADGFAASSSGSSAAAPSDPLDATTATPSESDDPTGEPLKLGRKPVADVLRGLVLGASMAAHQQLARSEYERDAGVWLMGEDEASAIADPLAKVAQRHAGGQLVNPDAGDLIAAGLAAVSYVLRNAVATLKIRRAVRRAGHLQDPQQEEGAA